MPLFAKKPAATPSSRRNPAAEHNARLRARAGSAAANRRPTPASTVSKPETTAATPSSQPSPTPGERMRLLTSQAQNVSRPSPAEPSAGQIAAPKNTRSAEPRSLPIQRFVRAAVNIYKAISIVINIVLIILVLVLAISLKHVTNTLNSVLSGLYENFVVMDNAAIATTIHVEDIPIPINFVLPVQQEEIYVTLTRDVTIRNATVGVLSVPTNVTLPAGTKLPIALSMEVPVDTTLTVDLDVPVYIKLSEANPPAGQPSLHAAFLGLQDTVGPFYCLFTHPADSPAALVCEGKFYKPQSTP